MTKPISTLRILFADSLSEYSTLIKDADKANDLFLLMEVEQEMNYVWHHVKKVIFLFSAMRHFAQHLSGQGYRVLYIKHTDPDNTQSFEQEITRITQQYTPKQIAFMTPGEYRVRRELLDRISQIGLPYQEHHDVKFLIGHQHFKAWATGKKSLQMEYFYRNIRKQLNVLMKDGKPVGGKWNYDAQNRQKAPVGFASAPPLRFKIDKITQSVIDDLVDSLHGRMGDPNDFHFAVTRSQALAVLDHFIEHNLKNFGIYQDAMLKDEPWMSHSHISFYLNIGLLQPMECIEAVMMAYDKGKAPLNSVEGFVRQILGWREYIRGIYWLYMPDYQKLNALNADQSLPKWFWDGKTDMKCMQQCLSQTINNAYAHHIQRLMVIGNYCLLTGIEPEAVQAWYLAVYADAFEWVELPNVQGMILFADGGLMATKPYAASGAYINKMSNYCEGCRYSVKEKLGEKACPFNYLYWYFMDKHQNTLKQNPRLAFTFKQLEKMPAEKLTAIRKNAELWLSQHHVD